MAVCAYREEELSRCSIPQLDPCLRCRTFHVSRHSIWERKIHCTRGTERCCVLCLPKNDIAGSGEGLIGTSW